jgi:hypothetical protein
MPNQVDANGISVKTYAEVLAALTTAFQSIYGVDVNLDQNSPDGQLLNIIALMIMDQGALAVGVYNDMDPDQAVGSGLDGISQLCGISRKGGTYTKVAVTVTTDRAVNLDGLDTSTTPFTVQDASGNEFQLIATASLTTGANTLNFQAKDIGEVFVGINTLTIATTSTLGVVSVNNAAEPYELGADQETDSQMRIRRQRSVAVPSLGSLEGLWGALYSLDGIVEAIVYENATSSIDADGIPANGIWVIAEGATDEDIADLIYKYRALGIPMKGSETVDIEQVDGSTFTAKFDRPTDEDLYIEMNVNSLSGGAIDTTALKDAIEAAWTFGIYDTADITALNSLVREINPDLVVTSSGVSLTAGSYTPTVTPTLKSNKFVVDAANITVTTI